MATAKKHIAVLAGDGIGPEVINQGRRAIMAVSEKYDCKFEFEECLIGAAAIDQEAIPLPVSTLEVCENADAILLGAVGLPKYDHDPRATIRPEQGLLGLRKALDLFANVRPVIFYPELAHASVLKQELISDVNFTIYRELSSGIYFGEKLESKDGSPASDICTYKPGEIKRIAKWAFRAAQDRRKKLCLIDKANVLATSRLWRKVVRKMAAQFPDVEVNYQYVDNAAMQIVLNPSQYDVILCSNMFGDIISDLSSALVGSLGLLPSASYGKSTALFEPVHGSWPDAAGKDIANPVGAILSVAMMLDYLKMPEAADDVRRSVAICIAEGMGTTDMKPQFECTCSKFGELVAIHILEDGVKMGKAIVDQATGTII